MKMHTPCMETCGECGEPSQDWRRLNNGHWMCRQCYDNELDRENQEEQEQAVADLREQIDEHRAAINENNADIKERQRENNSHERAIDDLEKQIEAIRNPPLTWQGKEIAQPILWEKES